MHRSILAAVLFPSLALGQAPLKSRLYKWKSVQMVGGGFIDGIVFHPKAKGVAYCRTDIGGAYRWDAKAKRWQAIQDWLPYEDTNLMGVESIALDPADSKRLYMACGMYTNATSPNAAILRSSDRGKTFQRTNMPFKMGGNENGRGNGERLAVDPNDGRILYFGSRQAGLWKSTDRAVTWAKVENFPAPTGPGAGVVTVVFDPHSGGHGKPSQMVYAASSMMGQPNLFRSADGGMTWAPLAGEPTQNRPTHTILSSDGTLYVTYGSDPGPNRMRDGSVWKLNTGTGEWTDITPDKPDATRAFGYAAVSVDAQHPQTLIVSSFGHPGGEEIYRSTDSGKNWRPVIGKTAQWDYSKAPYVARTPIHWLFDVEIDPANPDHALFTTGYGGYETFNLSDVDSGKPSKWQVMSTGVEETVALELLSPTEGAHLLTAIGDYGGFVHWDLDKPAPEGNYDHPHFGNTNSVAGGAKAPNVIVRTGRGSGNRGGGNIGYTLDGGKSWQPTASTPEANASLGRICVSADGQTWIWTLRSATYWTQDQGATWTACQGLTGIQRVIADTEDSRRFYAMDLFGGKLFTSNDGGRTFLATGLGLPGGSPVRGGDRGDNRGGQDQIYTTPGRTGDLWVAAFEGLYHSTNTEVAFTKLAHVQQIHGFGFGKAAPGSNFPALYLVGIVDGVRGVYRSDDEGRSWVRINDDQHQWGLILLVSGDPRVYGRVYIGTHGRGTLYGDPK